MQREELIFYLQHPPAGALQRLCDQIADNAELTVIQKPTQQTLLVPVRDPINDGQFIGGEALVTSAIVQVNGINGWGMVMDQNDELARAVATLDGAFAAGICVEQIVALAGTGKEIFEGKRAKINQRIEETRVSFDLM